MNQALILTVAAALSPVVCAQSPSPHDLIDVACLAPKIKLCGQQRGTKKPTVESKLDCLSGILAKPPKECVHHFYDVDTLSKVLDAAIRKEIAELDTRALEREAALCKLLSGGDISKCPQTPPAADQATSARLTFDEKCERRKPLADTKTTPAKVKDDPQQKLLSLRSEQCMGAGNCERLVGIAIAQMFGVAEFANLASTGIVQAAADSKLWSAQKWKSLGRADNQKALDKAQSKANRGEVR
jgi:hypothetical protein